MIEALAIFSPLVLGLLLGIKSQARWRRTCREGAAKIYREVSEMYAGTHEYRIARDSDFPGLEISGYLEVRSFLLARGFRHLGWLENLTVTRVYPEHRTGIEAHVDADGTTTATSFHIGGRQYLTLGSVLVGDRFLMTGNTDLDTLIPPPALDKCTLPHETPLADLVARHYQRLQELRAEDGDAQLLTVATLEEEIATCQQFSRIASDHRRALGLLTRQEMLSFATRIDQERGARAIWEEFQRLVAKPPSA